jgi:molybdenum cofactor synthesis domain-containing protein
MLAPANACGYSPAHPYRHSPTAWSFRRMSGAKARSQSSVITPGSARHIRKRGGDFETGDELLASGRLLDPRAIVAAAAADVAELRVFIRPRAHILSTGDELADPGTAANTPDAIPESVSFGVAALAELWGAFVVGGARLRDELPAMEKAAADAVNQADVVIVTGGASVGEKDFAKTMFEPLGLELVFSKVAIKPGKPVWLGRVDGALVLGLPGNPTSALVTARLLLAPLLAGLTGRSIDEALRWRRSRLHPGWRSAARAKHSTAPAGAAVPSRLFRTRTRAPRSRLPRPICWYGSAQIRRRGRPAISSTRSTSSLRAAARLRRGLPGC